MGFEPGLDAQVIVGEVWDKGYCGIVPHCDQTELTELEIVLRLF
jgi:hypothetical protein